MTTNHPWWHIFFTQYIGLEYERHTINRAHEEPRYEYKREVYHCCLCRKQHKKDLPV